MSRSYIDAKVKERANEFCNEMANFMETIANTDDHRTQIYLFAGQIIKYIEDDDVPKLLGIIVELNTLLLTAAVHSFPKELQPDVLKNFLALLKIQVQARLKYKGGKK